MYRSEGLRCIINKRLMAVFRMFVEKVHFIVLSDCHFLKLKFAIAIVNLFQFMQERMNELP